MMLTNDVYMDSIQHDDAHKDDVYMDNIQYDDAHKNKVLYGQHST